MNEYFQQAVQNKIFLNGIETNYPNTFYDWKITVTFYIAIHLLKALGKKRGVNIGSSHYEIFNNLDPERIANPVTSLPPDVWKAYKRLYHYSKASRYDGIVDLAIISLSQSGDYTEVKKLFKTFTDYMATQHLRLNA